MDRLPQPSKSGARARPNLPPIQTGLDKRTSTRPKPPPPENVTGTTATEKVPLKAPKPQNSRSSLRAFFNKTKSIGRSSKNENPSSPDYDPKPFIPISPIREDRTPAKQTTKTTKSYGNSVVPRSAVSSTPNHAPKISKPVKEKRNQAIPFWEPPPLFKAYPQAIKHATLPAPCLPADAIVRAQQLIKHGSPENSPDFEGKEKRDYRQAMKAADSLYRLEWTRKIFMLVTSGYLLQYSADGSFDRLPEMILELGSHCAAFASDAIPGKHWVLQISQTFDDNGTATIDSKKTFLSRIRLPDSPKMAKSFLLVLESADDLAAWLLVMRREIEGLSGNEYIPKTPGMPDTAQPLHRYQSLAVMRNAPIRDHRRVGDQGKQDLVNRPSPSVSSATLSPSTQTRLDEYALLQANRRSLARSVETHSPSTSTSVSDFDRLRDGSRLSYVSAGTRTIPSSHGSSPPSSSAGPKFAMPRNSYLRSPESPKCGSMNLPVGLDTQPGSVIRGPSSFRRDMGAYQHINPQPAVKQPSMTAPLKSAPNFSVPVFSKRFSSATNLRPLQPPSTSQASDTSPAFSATRSSYCSSETSIDSTPEETLPVDHRRGRSMYPQIINPSSIVHERNRSRERSKQASCQSKVTLNKPYRYSVSGHNDVCSPISEIVPDSPIVNLQMTHAIRRPAHYPRSSIPNANANAEAQHPIEDKKPALRRPMSLQVTRTSALSSTYQLSSSTGIPTPTSRNSMTSKPPASSNHLSTPPPPPHKSSRKTSLSPQRSMPQLVFGPPPAPPPNCPLPEIPPVASSKPVPTWNPFPHVTAKQPSVTALPQIPPSGIPRSNASPRSYRASLPAARASRLGDIRAAKKQGILQSC